MTHNYILDDNQNAVPEPDLLTWARWFETADRHVAKTQVGEFWVSTVFLGLDHAFGGATPILFETMICRQVPDNGTNFGYEWLDGCLRYPTWDHAEWGHEAIVRRLTEKLAEGSPMQSLLAEVVAEGRADNHEGDE